ncbi:oxygen-independent coproporphyrinogen III oxidase [Dawidia soli]|uniref:Coproporphyrinogen-III oxidase n=1 Tax=Dawidia soli TaxID=2782352 RepID=A0AAP2DE29_9BACT|nr:oxygen-independent coproporphyrinogen III oxidase [Dawidia soli]MBT1689070.1 oxygen-independent coproporphyrinogen III oxidase [Dawidia soli]
MIAAPETSLLKKYDVPVPRYTSYPTVPCWNVSAFSAGSWVKAVEKAFDETNDCRGISLYIHLPFCESLCTYCACNTRITKNHAVEERYLRSVLTEWELYRYIFGKKPVLRELHLGGGTPTFFSPQNLHTLLHTILESCTLHPAREFSFEGHPNNTTAAHLQALYDLGFRRVSYGVQDLDLTVQTAIHRIQPFANVDAAVRNSRQIGYDSIGFDLIYGLPYQTVETIAETFRQVIQLRPDRIAFYSYAHVPWLKPGQRGYEDANLPNDTVKRQLYETGRRLLHEAGYHDIGMDHFSLATDSLYNAAQEGTLHRNFMGYTTSNTRLLVGLGASAISDAGYAYGQNSKNVEEYEATVAEHQLPLLKGHVQTDEDRLLRTCILEIACQGKLRAALLEQASDEEVMLGLRALAADGIVKIAQEGLFVTEMGRAFVRNVCHVFDKRMRRLQVGTAPVFSKAI